LKLNYEGVKTQHIIYPTITCTLYLQILTDKLNVSYSCIHSVPRGILLEAATGNVCIYSN